MSTYNFSFYKGPISKIVPSRDISLFEAMELIRSDKFKPLVEQLRKTEDKVLRVTLKKMLPYFTFSGTFTKRLTDSLKMHSGLLVLDFDGLFAEQLTELSEQFKTIPWVCAFWISPSGNGLKLLVKIKPNQHLQSFIELAEFFLGNFSLAVDQSGKDIARACFVSYDPALYYKPDAAVFEAQEVVKRVEIEESKVIEYDAKNEAVAEHFRKQKFLRRVEHVVSQIVKQEIDITDNDYDNRLLIGFSLATLGEEAYEYYIKSVQFNDYDENPREKFNDALAKGKFKTPNKFFSLAREHGLSVDLPVTLQEAQKKADALQVIGNEESSNDFVKYGIYKNKSTNTYFSLDTKGIPREISNFDLQILFHVNTSDDVAYRLILIKNVFGLERVIRINTDDFVSAGTFKKVIARQGNFLWKGMDYDLVRLQDLLQRNECHTTMVKELGWNKRGHFYAFANGLFDNETDEFKPINDYGIVELGREGKMVNYFVPAMSSIFLDKDDQYTNEKKFKFQQSTITFEQWANQYHTVFGDNAMFTMLFYIAAVHSDIIYKDMGARFPILFVYGKRGTGKGAIVESLMRLFGEGQDQLMLGGASTIVGFMQKLAQFVNAIVWFDEYKNNINPKSIESIKNVFDRKGPERGKRDHSYETEIVPVRSALIMSGQEMPTIENALFTRTLMVTQMKTKFSEEERMHYNQLIDMETAGISHLTVQVLGYRHLFEKGFRKQFQNTLREFITELNNNDIDERLVKTYSMFLAVAELLWNKIRFPFSMSRLKAQCLELIKTQHSIVKGSDDTSKFWQVLESLHASFEISEGQQFLLANGYLYLRIQDVYQIYVEAMYRRREPNVLDKATLDNYLISDLRSFVGREKKQFGGKYSWCLVFKYKELGIDLIKGGDAIELRAKYISMGMEDALEEMDIDRAAAGFPNVNQEELDF